MVRAGLIFTFLLLSLFSDGQRNNDFFFWPINPSNEKIDVSEVVRIKGGAEELFEKAKTFVITTFVNERDSILLIDTFTNTIASRSSYLITMEQLGDRGKGFVSFDLIINCKENAYNYSITNLAHYPLLANGVVGGPLERETPASGGYVFPHKYWYQLKAKSYYNVQNTIERIKEAMSKVL